MSCAYHCAYELRGPLHLSSTQLAVFSKFSAYEHFFFWSACKAWPFEMCVPTLVSVLCLRCLRGVTSPPTHPNDPWLRFFVTIRHNIKGALPELVSVDMVGLMGNEKEEDRKVVEEIFQCVLKEYPNQGLALGRGHYHAQHCT